ncbi:hypothetical protein [Streptomyces hydrogenans]|uniref:hypothetical protein n=1 Tax=Streptomyces hydrogenans TaxID=1873719 RepID=UPI0035DD175A
MTREAFEEAMGGIFKRALEVDKAREHTTDKEWSYTAEDALDLVSDLAALLRQRDGSGDAPAGV